MKERKFVEDSAFPDTHASSSTGNIPSVNQSRCFEAMEESFNSLVIGESAPNLVKVHPSSVLDVDEDGKLPMYLLYHELMNTSSPFMRNVCRVEREWVLPVLEKFEKMDINRLSGSSGKDEPQESTPILSPKREASVVEAPEKASDRDLQIQAARERYLARKEKK